MIMAKIDAAHETGEPSLDSGGMLACWHCGAALSEITEASLNDSGVNVLLALWNRNSMPQRHLDRDLT